jgi:hypothetical protein
MSQVSNSFSNSLGVTLYWYLHITDWWERLWAARNQIQTPLVYRARHSCDSDGHGQYLRPYSGAARSAKPVALRFAWPKCG